MGPSVTLPKLSIAAKLYAIFALLASATVVLSALAIFNTQSNVSLTDDVKFANAGSQNVERMKGLIHAVQSAARGVAMSPDQKTAAPYLADLGSFNDQIDKVFTEWQKSVRPDDAEVFKKFSILLSAFQNFAPELARIASESGSQAVREWAEKSFPAESHNELNLDLAALSRHYADRAR